MRFTHTPETDAVIRSGYAVNRRVADIAADLGVTRNVVIGRARRLGLADKERWAASMRSDAARAIRSVQAIQRWADPDYKRRTSQAISIGKWWSRRQREMNARGAA